MKSIVIIAPNSFGRLSRVEAGMATSFQLLTKTHHFATLPNLARLIRAPEDATPKMARGRETVNPMAGYYLESFLKIRLRGYDAKTVFEWTTDTDLVEALDPEPLAVLFSTTFVPHRAMLEDCLEAVRGAIGSLPLIVGGSLIWKHKIEMERYAATGLGTASKGRMRKRLLGRPLMEGLQQFGVDPLSDNLFSSEPIGVLERVIFVASEFGEHTLLRVLEELERGSRGPEDVAHIPNQVLPTGGGSMSRSRSPSRSTLSATSRGGTSSTVPQRSYRCEPA